MLLLSTHQVDLLFKQHQAMLKSLYSRYRLKPNGGGLRPKVLKLDGWLALMSVSQSGGDGRGHIVQTSFIQLWTASQHCVIVKVSSADRAGCSPFGRS